MSWWHLGPSLLAAAAILFVPGLLVGGALGLRRLPLLAGAPALGVSLLALWAVAAQLAQVPYSPAGLVLVAVVVAAGIAGIRAIAGRGRRSADAARVGARPRAAAEARALAAPLGAAGIAAVIIGWRLKGAFGRPENISQTYDNIFHLNAVRYGLETGDASSLTITRFLSDVDAPSFYPAAWHDLAIGVAQLNGGSIPFAVNATNIVLAAVVWPIGCIFLARQIFGPAARVALWSGVVSTAFPAFPLLMVDFGVLYPYMMSLAILPTAIALLVGVLRAARHQDHPAVPMGAALLLILPGLGLAHPSTVLAYLLLVSPLLLAVLGHRARRLAHSRARVLAYLWPVALVILFLEILRRLWIVVRPLPEASLWEARATQAQAIGEALAAAPLGRPVAWVVLALTLAGLVILVRRGRPGWVSVSFALACGLYVVANGTPFGDFRSFVTGVWYNDPFRLAALLPVLAVPVAVAAVLALHEWIERRATLLTAGRSPRGIVRWGVPAVLAIVLGWSVQGEAMDAAEASASSQYRLTDDSALLSEDESRLLEQVDDVVPADESVVASPWTGASLVYPLADRESLTPYVFGARNEDVSLILERLSDVMEDPAVCEAVESENSYWVLDFGLREVHGGAHPSPGLLDLADNEGLEVAAEVGDARLYEITACSRD